MENESKIVSEIMNEGTRKRLEFFNAELEKHFAECTHYVKVADVHSKIEKLMEDYHYLAAELPVKPELKIEMDEIDAEMKELSESIRDAGITPEGMREYIKKGGMLNKKIAHLQHMLDIRPEDAILN